MRGRTADNSGRNEIYTRCPDDAKFPSVKIDVSLRKIKYVIREYKPQKEIDLYYSVSDLIVGHIDFDQCEFCVVCATRISFLPVVPAVPPFINIFFLGTARSIKQTTKRIL